MAGSVGHESVIQQANLHQVLADSSRLDVVVVRLRDTTKKVHGVGIAKVIVESAQDESLGAQDLSLGEAIIGNASKVLDVRREHFFVLGGNEHGSDADELQTIELDDLFGEKSVDDVDGEEEGFGQEVEAGVDLDEPVNQNTTRFPLEVVLV